MRTARAILQGVATSAAGTSSLLAAHTLERLGLERGRRRHIDTILKEQAPLTRAEKANLIPSATPKPLTEAQWAAVEAKWVCHGEEYCPICLHRFGGEPMLCTSCCHAVHKRCFDEWLRRTAGRWRCPICMLPANMHESQTLLEWSRERAVIVIQAGIRGYRDRRLAHTRRSVTDGSLAGQMHAIAHSAEVFAENYNIGVRYELTRLESELNEADALLDAFLQQREVDWYKTLALCQEKRLDEVGKDVFCPICYEPLIRSSSSLTLNPTGKVSIVSCCAELFHTACLNDYMAMADKPVCPHCKAGFLYTEIDGFT
ncbi:Ring finger domain-containing protein [Giardia muris]|uniref:Ring finger domain-containing protein n=1 Tax=Giardia muris TaxID=5742 RepID=A0A4Z1T9A3_GIAMU|nr:Ring finger domain-containing protein [Giardia muris]|eukprot:TNJ29109.1 Ring finger domain-containing protein [Giardia muris]